MSDGVHQVVAGAAPRDAITQHVVEAQRVLRGLGLRSEIFADAAHIHAELAGVARPAGEWDRLAQPGDAAILHYSIASSAFAHVMARCPRTAMHYHNITPAHLLWRFAPQIALECAAGRRHLNDLVGRVRSVGADSAFNGRELEELGFAPAAVLGVMRPELPPVPPLPGGGGDGPARLLFVGRGVPNKAQHHLVMTSAALRDAGVDHELWLVGSWAAAPDYERHCRRLARTLAVEDRVRFLGSVSEAELARRYAEADLFLCLSDHEGFCVPLIEAMAGGLPIVAHASSAVPETVGAAGLLLEDKPPSLVAEAVAETLRNPRVQAAQAAARPERLDRFSQARLAERLVAFVEAIP